MNAAQVLIDMLVAEGVTRLFGIPGSQHLQILDALYGRNDIRYTLTRHEQGAAYMAYGYARARRGPGVCISTVGPGSTNLMTGVFAAYKAQVPLVVITSKQDQRLLERDTFQEIDQVDLYKPITKWSYLVTNPAKLPEAVRKAFRIAMTPPRGPVHLNIPKDVLGGEALGQLVPPAAYRATALPVPDDAVVRMAADLLARAESPLIIAGRDLLVEDGTAQLIAFAEKRGIPVATTNDNPDAFPTNRPLGMGLLGHNAWKPAKQVLAEADVVVALGAQFGFHTTNGYKPEFLAGKQLIQVAHNPHEIGAVYPVAAGAAGSVTAFLAKLDEAMGTRCWTPSASLAAARAEWEAERTAQADSAARPLKSQYVVQTVRRLLPEDATICVDGGNFNKHVRTHIETYQPHTFFTADNAGPVGNSLPVAIGVQAARPDRRVVTLCGDMGFAMNMAELETAAREGLPVVGVVFNDAGLGNIRAYQDFVYGGRRIGSDYSRVDFAQIARGLGAWGRRVEDPAELEGVLREALAAGGPAVVDVSVDPTDLAEIVFKSRGG